MTTATETNRIGIYWCAEADDRRLFPDEIAAIAHIFRRSGNGWCTETIANIARHIRIGVKRMRIVKKLLVAASIIEVHPTSGGTDQIRVLPVDSWKPLDAIEAARSELKQANKRAKPTHPLPQGEPLAPSDTTTPICQGGSAPICHHPPGIWGQTKEFNLKNSSEGVDPPIVPLEKKSGSKKISQPAAGDLLAAYNANKPENWSLAQKLTDGRRRTIDKWVKGSGGVEIAKQKLIQALEYAKRDDWWAGRKAARDGSYYQGCFETLDRKERFYQWSEIQSQAIVPQGRKDDSVEGYAQTILEMLQGPEYVDPVVDSLEQYLREVTS